MQKMMIPLIAVVSLLAVGTYFQGVFSERWIPQTSERLEAFTKCVSRVPLQIGKWEGRDDKLDPEEFKKTNCTAYVSRRYTNAQSGESVSVYLVSGTARHCTIHSPDWCYQGAGFKMQGKAETHKIPVNGMNPAPEFSTAVFKKQEQGMRIYWSYAENGEWRGPKFAKTALAGKPAMYKVYLIGPPTTLAENPVDEFAQVFFPKVNPLLFPLGSTQSVAAGN
jgi:hypothetical protein